MQNFIQIMESGDFKYLFKVDNYDKVPSETVETNKDLAVLWGEIILEYGHLDQNLAVAAHFEDHKVLLQLENAYTVLKAMIRTLMFVSPGSNNPEWADLANNYIKDLRKLGYIIDITSSKAYKESLYAADRKSNQLVTRIKMKRNEIKNYSEDPDQEGDPREKVTFDQVITQLSAALQFNLSDNLTVSRYCEYRKTLKARNKKKQA